MRDSVPPVNQLLKQLSSSWISVAGAVNACPELNTQSVEIGADCAGMRIAFVQRAVPDELCAQKRSQCCRCGRNQMIDAFRMQVPAEPLKMGGEQRGIRVVDLLRRVSPASLVPPTTACAFSISFRASLRSPLHLIKEFEDTRDSPPDD